MNDIIFLVHLFSTVFLVGLIWTIQVVHYPLFAVIGENEYETYQKLHMRRIAYLVGPLMLIELLSGVYLLVYPDPLIGRWPFGIGLLLVALIWVSTALIQSPVHGRLLKKFDVKDIERLTASNWIRTVLWTARGILVLCIAWIRIVDQTKGF